MLNHFPLISCISGPQGWSGVFKDLQQRELRPAERIRGFSESLWRGGVLCTSSSSSLQFQFQKQPIKQASISSVGTFSCVAKVTFLKCFLFDSFLWFIGLDGEIKYLVLISPKALVIELWKKHFLFAVLLWKQNGNGNAKAEMLLPIH